MTRRTRLIAGCCAALALAGCANVSVYGPNQDQLKGIPFYVKVPVMTQETKLARTELQVQIVVSDITTPTAPIVSRYPPLGPVRISPDSKVEVERILTNLVNDTKGKTKLAETKRLASEAINALRKLPAPGVPMLVSNSWSLNMVVGPKAYFIANYLPLIGSATVDYKFAADGTLTEASATTQDDTVKTLLSLFPISAKISEDWGIKPTKALTEGVVPAVEEKVKLEANSNEIKTIYTLRKNTLVDGGADMNMYFGSAANLAPLTYDDAKAGTKGVQLVAEETGSDSSKGKTDGKSYQISGTVTPPSTDAGAAPPTNSTDSSAGQGADKSKAKKKGS